MTSLSIRLPDELESRLSLEARREGKPRSEIIREAIAEYVGRKEWERFMSEVASAANALARDLEASSEGHEMAEDLVDEGLDALIAAERFEDDPDRKWWK